MDPLYQWFIERFRENQELVRAELSSHMTRTLDALYTQHLLDLNTILISPLATQATLDSIGRFIASQPNQGTGLGPGNLWSSVLSGYSPSVNYDFLNQHQSPADYAAFLGRLPSWWFAATPNTSASSLVANNTVDISTSSSEATSPTDEVTDKRVSDSSEHAPLPIKKRRIPESGSLEAANISSISSSASSHGRIASSSTNGSLPSSYMTSTPVKGGPVQLPSSQMIVGQGQQHQVMQVPSTALTPAPTPPQIQVEIKPGVRVTLSEYLAARKVALGISQ